MKPAVGPAREQTQQTLRRTCWAAVLVALPLCAGLALRYHQKPGRVPAAALAVRSDHQQKRYYRRSMLAFSTNERSNVLGRRGWYAVWCYLPNVERRTVHHWRGSRSVLHWARQLAEDQTPNDEQEFAVLNGGYFGYDRRLVRSTGSRTLRQPLIGSAGNGRSRHWSHGSPPSTFRRDFQRWAFGMQQAGSEPGGFRIELMQRRSEGKGYWVPPALENQFPYGLSALLCLLKNGEPIAWRQGASSSIHLEPRGQWESAGEFAHGYYRRAAIGWTNDGKHLFLLVHHFPRDIIETRDLFGVYDGKNYKGPGALLWKLREAFAAIPPAQHPCAPGELPRRIENAMLLDGGRSASLIYRRYRGKNRLKQNRDSMTAGWEERGSWLTGPAWKQEAPPVPTMIEVIEK